MYFLHNMTFAMIPECLNAFPVSQQWRCVISAVSYPFAKYPIFISNSFFDSFQQDCIYTAEPVQPGATIEVLITSMCEDRKRSDLD